MQEDAILKILVWFDIFDWPLTEIELWKYFPSHKITNHYKDTNKFIESRGGFFFLRGRGNTIQKRIYRQKVAIKKLKIGKLAAEILSYVPFVKMIAICNDLSYFNAPKESDIDFFIIVKSGRIWTTRFLSTAIFFVLGLWRHGKKIKNRICLSFFIADDNLNLKEIAYENDIYLKFWILQILPLFNRRDTYQRFFKENSWTTDEFPNFFPNLPVQKIKIGRKFLQIIFEKILEGFLGNFLEKILKTIQVGIMRKKIPYQKDRNVIISDKMLKFHENDRRKYFRNTFNQRLIEIREHS